MSRGVALLAVALVAFGVLPASALDWGGITPGVSTREAVRGLYGQPTRTATAKVEGFDTAEWVYEGPKAPGGLHRLTVEFGLKTADRYRPELVRAVRLEPRPGAFNRATILTGWGTPAAVKAEEGREAVYFYPEGLVVYYDTDGWTAKLLLFTPPQPPPPVPAEKKP
jgi:hypothetical protein